MVLADRAADPDEETLLRATVPARTLVELRTLKLLTGDTVEEIVNDAVDRYLVEATGDGASPQAGSARP